MTLRSALAAPLNQLERVRGLVPLSMVPRVVERRVDKAWALPAYRAMAEKQMNWLLEFTDRADEVPDLARGYLEQMTLRQWLRWHEQHLIHQPVRGIERLTGRDRSRPAVLNFMHHGRYDGMFASVTNAGAPVEILMSPLILQQQTPVQFKQHVKVMAHAGPIHRADIGIQQIHELMRPGVLMCIASDVPSQTEVTFLGRRALGSSGAPRIATDTDALVVPLTAHRDTSGESATGTYLQVHPLLDPRDFADPMDLLAAMLAVQEQAVLEWPEAVEVPVARFAPLGSPPLTAPWMTG